MGEDVNFKTGQICSTCGSDLLYGQDVYLLQVVVIHLVQDASGQIQLTFEAFLDDDQEYYYFPNFIDPECWMKERESLKECVEELDIYSFQTGICKCTICSSDITDGEVVGTAHQGQFKVSEFSPNGESAAEFDIPPQRPDIICACCMEELNSSVTTYWEDLDFVDPAEERERAWESGNTTSLAMR